jgi:hypothetical protein
MRKYFTKQYNKEKKLKEALRKQNDVRNEIKSFPFKKLDTPIQKGWIIEMSINPDLKQKDYDFIQACLVYFSKSFEKNNCFKKHIKSLKTLREIKYLKYINKDATLFPIRTSVVPIDEVYNVVKKLTSDYYDDRFFYLVIESAPSFTNIFTSKKMITIQLFLRQEYCKTKIKQNLIYEIKDIDPIILQELDELEPYIEEYWRNNYGKYKKSSWDRIDNQRKFNLKYNFI